MHGHPKWPYVLRYQPLRAQHPQQIMHPALTHLDHRPWPIPAGRWAWRQSWHDLLFAHWPIDAAALRPLVPEALTIEEYEGTSWIGVVPFRMSGVMRRPLPDLPWISAFPELNLRVYVTCQGKPGVWFLSLDAANPLAVWAARRFFHLPYHGARMQMVEENNHFQYDSVRHKGSVAFRAVYGPTDAPFAAAPGTLMHWLTERYCLYAQSPRGTLFRCEVHHAPWPLQPAFAEIQTNELLQPHGLSVEGEPLLHFARQLDVVVWSPEKVSV